MCCKIPFNAQKFLFFRFEVKVSLSLCREFWETPTCQGPQQTDNWVSYFQITVTSEQPVFGNGGWTQQTPDMHKCSTRNFRRHKFCCKWDSNCDSSWQYSDTRQSEILWTVRTHSTDNMDSCERVTAEVHCCMAVLLQQYGLYCLLTGRAEF
jgi:hypothetical protein